MVEIKLMCNVKLIISLCFIIWNGIIKNDEMDT
jgi:hypothetical protein